MENKHLHFEENKSRNSNMQMHHATKKKDKKSQTLVKYKST